MQPHLRQKGRIMRNKRLIIGIGNPLLQDDRAGIEIIERLEARGDMDCDLLDLYTVGFEVIDSVKGRDEVIIVDACKLGYQPGEIVEVQIEDIFTNAHLTNSHAVTLGTTLKMGYEVFEDEMPEKLTILLIEIDKVEKFTKVMTPPVQQAVDELERRLVEKWGKKDAPASA